jgi:hypothetical protein
MDGTAAKESLLVFLTGNAGTGKAPAFSEAIARRLENVVVFKPLGKEAFNAIAGRMAAKTLGAENLTGEQSREVGEILMATVGDVNPDEGARGVTRKISQLLSGPLGDTVEDSLAPYFPVFAEKTCQRRAAHLSDTFLNGTATPVKKMGPLRICRTLTVTA